MVRKQKYELEVGTQKFDNIVDFAKAQLERDLAKSMVSKITDRLKLIKSNEELIQSLALTNKVLEMQLKRFKKNKISPKEISEDFVKFLSQYEKKDWGTVLVKIEKKIVENL